MALTPECWLSKAGSVALNDRTGGSKCPGIFTFVVGCLKRALISGKPEIINSDQGGHFINPDYIKLLEDAKVRLSGRKRSDT